jgi:ATP-binding cassette, subfamily B, bacterial
MAEQEGLAQTNYTDWQLLQRYGQFIRPLRWTLIGVFGLYFSNAVLNLIPALSLRWLIDGIVVNEAVSVFGLFEFGGPAWFPDQTAQIWGVILFSLVIVVEVILANVIGVWMWRAGTRVSQRMLLDIKQRVHLHLHKLSIGYFERERTGSIMSRCVGDVEQMEQMLKQSFNLFYGLVHLLAVPVLMLGMSPLLFCFVLPPIPIILICVQRIRVRLRPLYKQMREQQAEIGAAIQEQIAGIREIKAFDQVAPAHRTYTRANIAYIRIVHDSMKIFSINHQILYGNRDLAMLLVAMGGGMLVITGSGAVSVGIILAFLPLLTRFFDPIHQLVGFYDTIQRGLASTERVFGFLDQKPEVQDRPDAQAVVLRHGAVRFEHVHFGYSATEPVLHAVDLDIPAGTQVAIVGPTGAGKTTLISLLLRFYQPQQGRILIDDHDIAELRYESLAAAFGIVFQETFLFYGSIAQNIAFSRADASMADIRDAARRARIDDFISDLPDGYDTMVGERGVKLSGGQRQRLAIARMILKKPAIVLLDEATSAVDNETERAIQASLDELMHNRTCFIIAHRLSTIKNADLVICLDEGRVVQMGPPAQLQQEAGLFAKLLAAAG